MAGTSLKVRAEARGRPSMSDGNPIMRNMRFIDYLLKDRAGEESGKRAELVATLILGFVVTGLWAFIYRHPVIIVLTSITSLTALFSIVQLTRGKPAYPMVFPTIVMASVVAIALLDGHGLHDLIWMSGLGVYILVNMYSARNDSPIPLVFGFLVVMPFIAVGILEMTGILPNPYGTDLRYVILSSALMLGVMGAITAVFHRHRVLLRQAKESRQQEENSRERLEFINRNLEDQVRLRTAELNRLNEQLLTKTAKLQAASEISQEIMSNPLETIGDLLMRTTRSISEKLGYYHVGIFLIDEAREFAILRAANSKGGQEMLSKRHQLKVGGTGIVGYVAQSGRPRIALDTGVDAVFFNNPYLPETRSEISLPIRFGNTTIGVLDVQSTQSSAFTEEDTSTLMTIANQMAMILHQSGEHEDEPKSLRRAHQFHAPDERIGYSFHNDGSIAASSKPPENPYLEKAIATGETVAVTKSEKGDKSMLAVPVRFRDQVIGIIHIESGESNRFWTEDEIMLVQAISDRAALALENASLLEDATRRAEQEETISRITTQIGSSTDFERIMQTTIQELGLALGVSRSFIQIGSPAIPERKASE